MLSIQLLLAFAAQEVSCDAAGSRRSVRFSGNVHDDGDLLVTRGGPDFDARQSRWVVWVFDVEEQPLTDFYVECMTQRNLKGLSAAIHMAPNEYSGSAQPDIDVYVWLPPLAFASVWSVAPALQSFELQAVLNLTAPFRGSELHYSSFAPETYDKVWKAESENPLLIERSEFYISPLKRK